MKSLTVFLIVLITSSTVQASELECFLSGTVSTSNGAASSVHSPLKKRFVVNADYNAGIYENYESYKISVTALKDTPNSVPKIVYAELENTATREMAKFRVPGRNNGGVLAMTLDLFSNLGNAGATYAALDCKVNL